ncbi:TPA: hypothetical protein ACQGPN_005607 [Pseudomonas aeruginosa]|nr:hypothetical protein [Pseudomonas aeruginosa]MCC0277936.1 hypothetical protein [Pseudomonas aeruginosa]MCG7026113.1 hypothetical protein [Pseudomonas aeruginosa]MCG7037936.1 hypothetical protein [Pseudomonas aeruginosa]MCG7044036.1 hypothetical protein [Pseudomonas aeruginosa]MCG7056690.1 hypothetical protein [Pseudomonas aeruginosa]
MRCLEKKGLLTMSSQLIGVLAASTQGDADAKSLQTGAWVAGNATQHNYLSHWHEEKKRQEVDGCKDKQLCKTGIEAKWAIISAQQDVGIVVGVGGGIGLSTAETAVGVYELVKNWRETYAALEQLATSPEFRQQFGDNYLKGLEERAAFLTQAYEDAGWQGSVTAGVEGGRFAAELVGVLTAVKGGAQITAKLPTAAKNLVNAIAESPVSGSMSSQLGAVGDLGKLGGGPKGSATALQNFGGRTANDLVAAATEPINKEGLTKAARALTKHASGQRATGTFPKLTGGIENQNSVAQKIVDEIVTDPKAVYTNLSRGGLEIRVPDGRGIRYNSDGSFSTFLDPKL